MCANSHTRNAQSKAPHHPLTHRAMTAEERPTDHTKVMPTAFTYTLHENSQTKRITEAKAIVTAGMSSKSRYNRMDTHLRNKSG